MRYYLSTAVVLAVLFSLGFGTNVYSGELYGTSQVARGFDPDGESIVPVSILNKIDPETGEPTEIGEIGYTNCAGLDFEPGTNRLFAVCQKITEQNGPPLGEEVTFMDGDEIKDILVEVDRLTGAGTEIGPLEIEFVNQGEGMQTRPVVTDISFSPDGVLHGIASGFEQEQGGGGGGNPAAASRQLELVENSIFTIDTITGKASGIGATNTGDSVDSIGFSPLSRLYHATDNAEDEGTFNMLSTATGNGTNIANIDHPPGFDPLFEQLVLPSMDYSQLRGKLFALLASFPRSDDPPGDLGELGLTRAPDGPGNYLATINADNGEMELIGLIEAFDERGVQFGAIAILNQGERSVPTMSEWGLIATGTLLLLAAVIFLRRRQLSTES